MGAISVNRNGEMLDHFRFADEIVLIMRNEDDLKKMIVDLKKYILYTEI